MLLSSLFSGLFIGAFLSASAAPTAISEPSAYAPGGRVHLLHTRVGADAAAPPAGELPAPVQLEPFRFDQILDQNYTPLKNSLSDPPKTAQNAKALKDLRQESYEKLAMLQSIKTAAQTGHPNQWPTSMEEFQRNIAAYQADTYNAHDKKVADAQEALDLARVPQAKAQEASDNLQRKMVQSVYELWGVSKAQEVAAEEKRAYEALVAAAKPKKGPLTKLAGAIKTQSQKKKVAVEPVPSPGRNWSQRPQTEAEKARTVQFKAGVSSTRKFDIAYTKSSTMNGPVEEAERVLANAKKANEWLESVVAELTRM